MKYSQIASVSAGLVAIALFGACAPEKPSDVKKNVVKTEAPSADKQDERPVAIVNGEEVSLGEFERRINSLAPFARARYTTTERKQEYLNSVVQFEVMADEAERRGLGDDPAVLHAMKEMMVRTMLNEELRARVSMRDISDADVEAVYKANLDAYRQPERRRAAILVVEDEALAHRLREAFLVSAEAETEERINAFRRLAHKHSTHRPSAGRGGDVGFLSADEDEPTRRKTAAAIFALDGVGDVSEVHQTERGWQVAMIIEKEDEILRPLDEVSRDIRTRLYEERRQAARQEFIDTLVRSATVETFPAHLQDLEITAPSVPRRLEELPLVPVRDLKQPAAAAQD